MLLKLKGVGSELELYEDKIIIKRTGILSKFTHGFTKGDKTIYIDQITGIELRPGGAFVNGYIQFTLPGGNERQGGTWEATTDENSIVFTKKHNDTALNFKNKVEELMRRHKEASNTSSNSDVAEKIRQLKDLLDDGIITSEEFNAKKKKLLKL